ncbi:MAG: hypothetical protein MI757_08600 [Pirellulales bacterium]|nr:hypothetical protein [Pirellulales bacterium]
MTSRPSQRLFAILAATALAATPASMAFAAEPSAALYKSKSGPYSVAANSRVALKRPGGEALAVRVTYPTKARADDERYPIIIFSHGALGSKDGYRPLIEHWASHGYVCVQPTHGDSLSKLSLREKLKIGSLKDHLAKVTSVEHWRTRPEEVRLIIDSLDEIESQVSAIKGRVNRERVGVGGHSFGAHTSMMVAGLELKHPATGRRASWSDKRPKVFVWISPQGTSKAADADAWKSITRPVLVITGTRDTSPRNGKGHRWRREAYENLPEGHKHFFLIRYAQHGFGGIVGRMRFPGSGPANAAHVDLVRSTALAMWDAHLKDDPRAARYLSKGEVDGAASDLATFESK